MKNNEFELLNSEWSILENKLIDLYKQEDILEMKIIRNEILTITDDFESTFKIIKDK